MDVTPHRRHLSGGQRAVIAVPLKEMLAIEAKERQREAGRIYGENHPKSEVLELVPEPLVSREQAAALVGVMHGDVSDAKYLTSREPVMAENVCSRDKHR